MLKGKTHFSKLRYYTNLLECLKKAEKNFIRNVELIVLGLVLVFIMGLVSLSYDIPWVGYIPPLLLSLLSTIQLYLDGNRISKSTGLKLFKLKDIRYVKSSLHNHSRRYSELYRSLQKYGLVEDIVNYSVPSNDPTYEIVHLYKMLESHLKQVKL